MKALKIILGIILALVIIWFGVGFFLPKTYHLERSTEINAPDSVIFANAADMNNYVKWDPFSQMDSTTTHQFEGTAKQPGQKMSWKGEQIGEGSMTIKEVQPNSKVVWNLAFIKPFEGSATSMLVITPSGAGNKVTWSVFGENKTTTERWMSLMNESMMGEPFENGVKSLKMLSEGEK